MELSNLDREQKIERYILSRMEEDEALEFEAFFLSNQECLNQLEVAEKLYKGLLAINQPLNEFRADEEQASNDKFWWRKKVPAWSLAAMLMITMLPSVYLYQNIQQHNAPLGSVAVVNIDTSNMRSSRDKKKIVVETSKRMIISIFMETDQFYYENYNFEIYKVGEHDSTWKEMGMRLDKNDMLYIDLGNHFLTRGEYDFAISGENKLGNKIAISKGVLIVTSVK